MNSVPSTVNQIHASCCVCIARTFGEDCEVAFGRISEHGGCSEVGLRPRFRRAPAGCGGSAGDSV
jgi:hypothetical protein